MTEPDQAARLAAIRARRGQSPVAITSSEGGERPARTPRAAAPAAATVSAATTPGVASWAPPVSHEVQIPAPPAARVAAPPAATSAAARPAATARTTAAAAAPVAKAKAKKSHPHIAAGARIVVTGLTASGIFGLTTVIAAANQPAPAANPVLDTTGTTVADPTLTTPLLDPTATTVAGAVPLAPGQTVVLTIPPVGGAPATAAPAAPSAQQQAPAANKPAQQPAAQTPTPATPAPAPAPTPPPTTAAPVTTPPPPPCTTNASGKCK